MRERPIPRSVTVPGRAATRLATRLIDSGEPPTARLGSDRPRGRCGPRPAWLERRERALDGRQQLGHGHRLDQVGDEAGVEAGADVALRPVTAERDGLDLAGALAAQAAA